MSEDEPVHIVGFAGSLREASFNRALLRACVDQAPPSLRIETFELHELPLYNGDVEDAGDPPTVVRLKESIAEADGLLVVTPEYNHGVPAVTKNAIDWASRPPERVLSEKPVAITGASPGMTGTARAQSSLRQSLASVNAFVMQSPGLLVSKAHEKFDDNRALVDETTVEFLEKFLTSFEAWVHRFS